MISDNKGAQAIIFLQNLAGIIESEESAKKIWNGFNEHEKEQTEAAYKVMLAQVN